jgi:hypothetical protein
VEAVAKFGLDGVNNAVIIEVPTPTIVVIFPTIVATDVTELVYVKLPLLSLIGGLILKAVFPKVFVGTEKLDSVETAWFTVKVVLIDPAAKLGVLV